MTATKEVTLFCDVCAEWNRYIADSPTQARKLATHEGWITQTPPNGPRRDLCPRCQTKPGIDPETQTQRTANP